MLVLRKALGIFLIVLASLLVFPSLFSMVSSVGTFLKIHDSYSFGYFLGAIIFCLMIFAIIFALYYYGIKLLKKRPVKRSEAEIINQDLT